MERIFFKRVALVKSAERLKDELFSFDFPPTIEYAKNSHLPLEFLNVNLPIATIFDYWNDSGKLHGFYFKFLHHQIIAKLQ